MENLKSWTSLFQKTFQIPWTYKLFGNSAQVTTEFRFRSVEIFNVYMFCQEQLFGNSTSQGSLLENNYSNNTKHSCTSFGAEITHWREKESSWKAQRTCHPEDFLAVTGLNNTLWSKLQDFHNSCWDQKVESLNKGWPLEVY